MTAEWPFGRLIFGLWTRKLTVAGPHPLTIRSIDDLLTRRNGQRRIARFIKLQIARSPNRQISNSPNRQITKSANHHRPWEPPKAGRAGTSTRRSTTGRTPARWAGRTCGSGRTSPGARPARSSNSGVGRAGSPCRLRERGRQSWAWIDPGPCWPTRPPARESCPSRAGRAWCWATSATFRFAEAASPS